MARRILFALLALGPAVVVLDRLGLVGELAVFVLAAAALVPLAWLIGAATEQAAHHTGPGIGGFLNATFGNAPELIIALFAVADGLTDVVRASLAGSIVGNLLLVLGFTFLFGDHGPVDRSSGLVSMGMVGLVALALLIPSVPGFHGDPDRRSLAKLSLPVAAVLLIVRVAVTLRGLRRHRKAHAAAEREHEQAEGWSLRASLAVLSLATVVVAFVTEALVGSLETFAKQAHLSAFFVAVVIVAIVGNAAEHGSAVLLATRGKVRLATEIPLASGAQVAGLLIPGVAIASWAIEPLALSFRPVEIAAMGGAAVLAAIVVVPGRSTRAGGAVLVAAYAAAVVAFYLAGNR